MITIELYIRDIVRFAKQNMVINIKLKFLEYFEKNKIKKEVNTLEYPYLVIEGQKQVTSTIDIDIKIKRVNGSYMASYKDKISKLDINGNLVSETDIFEAIETDLFRIKNDFYKLSQVKKLEHISAAISVKPYDIEININT